MALKVLKPELGAVLGVERFLAEIKVTANLQHPHLLPLFDSGAAVPVIAPMQTQAATIDPITVVVNWQRNLKK